mgnify:FL=1
MANQPGYLYLNDANLWSAFDLTDLVIAGDGALELAPGAASPFTGRGQFVAGPFEAGDKPTRWHQLTAMADPLPAAAAVQWYTTTRNDPDPPAFPAAVNTDLLTPVGQWRAVPQNALDALALNEPARYLWLAGTLQGDTKTTPRLHQIRLTYDRASWLDYLPAIYRRESGDDPFLHRLLALLESAFAEREASIDSLPAHFDPFAAPDDDPGHSWLDWLADWLAFELDESWTEARRRDTVARLFALYQQRGTVEGLRALIALYVDDAPVRIVEPAAMAHIWSLSPPSALGFQTQVAPAQPQGAVTDTTAILDESHLIAADEIGAPLFEDAVHHFTVEVERRAAWTEKTVQRLRDVIEREKPAHTTFSLRIVEPQGRVGVRSQLGVDAFVGKMPDSMRLDEDHLDVDTALPLTDADQGLGKDTRLNGTTALDDDTPPQKPHGSEEE